MFPLLHILLQAAPESWLVNLPSTIGVASILGFFVWYFISEKKKDDEKHDAAIEKLRVEQNTERQIYRDRIDSLIEKIGDITKQAIASNNQSSIVLNELKDAINELRNKK